MSSKALKWSIPLYIVSVRGTWKEYYYTEDSKRHVMDSSGNGAFLL